MSSYKSVLLGDRRIGQLAPTRSGEQPFQETRFRITAIAAELSVAVVTTGNHLFGNAMPVTGPGCERHVPAQLFHRFEDLLISLDRANLVLVPMKGSGQWPSSRIRRPVKVDTNFPIPYLRSIVRAAPPLLFVLARNAWPRFDGKQSMLASDWSVMMNRLFRTISRAFAVVSILSLLLSTELCGVDVSIRQE